MNPTTPNWTCTDTSVACYPSSANALSFHGLYMVRRSGTLYAYVQGGGNPGPCRIGGDNFCVFTAPDTSTGWTGGGVTLVNHQPRPDDGYFWQLRSAFFDSTYGKFFLVASRTEDGEPDDLMEAKLGESTDGINFSWTTLMKSYRTQLSVRLEDYVLTPHPSQSGVWIGTITGFIGYTGQPFVTPWKVDRNTGLIHLKDSSGIWRTVPIGGTLTFSPSQAYGGRVTHIGTVSAGGTWRLEAWGANVVSYTAGSGIANNPCVNGVPTAKYKENTCRELPPGQQCNPQQVGSTTVQYRIFDPHALMFTTDWLNVTSVVRGLPSDYLWAVRWMAFRLEAGTCEYIYTGSKDATICTHSLTWNAGAGSGILVTRADYVP